MSNELTQIGLLVLRSGEKTEISPSFNAEIVQLRPALRAFARTLTASHADADDLVQDTILRALVGRLTFQPGTNMKSWLFTIMRRAHVAVYHRDHRGGEMLSTDDPEFNEDLLPPAWGRQDSTLQWEDTNRLLGTLPEEQREAVLLITAGDLSVEQAAMQLGVEQGTIKSRVNRARLRMAENARRGNLSPRKGNITDHLSRHLTTACDKQASKVDTDSYELELRPSSKRSQASVLEFA